VLLDSNQTTKPWVCLEDTTQIHWLSLSLSITWR
jgi:hypothetical protein